VLSALEAGYEVYVVVDACGGLDRETHDAGLQRMEQVGARLVSWMGVMSEWQRDWTRYEDRRDGLMNLLKTYSGAFGQAASFEFGITGAAAS
jgi:hypothetical protein